MTTSNQNLEIKHKYARIKQNTLHIDVRKSTFEHMSKIFSSKAYRDEYKSNQNLFLKPTKLKEESYFQNLSEFSKSIFLNHNTLIGVVVFNKVTNDLDESYYYELFIYMKPRYRNIGILSAVCSHDYVRDHLNKIKDTGVDIFTCISKNAPHKHLLNKVVEFTYVKEIEEFELYKY